ncbi:O-antigen ligase [Sporomusa sp. KB1]|jgi:hypothetical protein|uniref:O-antigen ligase family protein n=1 Tax=Sporomusa sp. KB1 TaxID=943346 RepID=UPI0011A5F558|nr:O-antigen ligase family protein [Sporomusa sp. KB1]TWH45278.1 O-antigen ligase-like membrane protein [Sporomusa sp. KB1]
MFKLFFIIIFYLFLAELVLGGPGFWGINEIGISIRKLIFIALLITAYIQFFEKGNFKVYFRDKLIFLCIVLSTIIWMLVLPVVNGQGLGFAFQDGGSIFIFLLYFPIVQLIRTKLINWENVKKYFINLIIVVALFQVLIWINGTLDLGLSLNMISFFGADEYGSIYVGHMKDGFYRVMWISTVFTIPGIFLIAGNSRNNLLDYIKIVLFLFTLYISYTRALWLACIIGIMLVLLIRKRIKVKGIVIIAVVLCGMIGISIFTDVSETTFSRLNSLYDDDGTLERIVQIDSILDMWTKNFLFGIGFGGHAEYIRVQDVPFTYEVSLVSLLMKLGFVGVSLWGLTLACLFYHAKPPYVDREGRKKWLYTLAGTVAFLFSTATNPYLLNFVGMIIILFMIIEMEKIYIEKKTK